MKDLNSDLHTTARRYCIDRASYWRKEYAKLQFRKQEIDGQGYDYTNEEYATFPRYNVLDAILYEIEKYTGYDFSSLGEEKKLLCELGFYAESSFTKASNDDKAAKIVIEEFKSGTFKNLPIGKQIDKFHELVRKKAKDMPLPRNNEIEECAMNEERILFYEFINNITDEELKNIEPLYYRRTLLAEERKRIWEKLVKIWDKKEAFWVPLGNCTRKDVFAFLDDYFYNELGIGHLRNILLERGIDRVWQLREFEYSEYEIDTLAFEPTYSYGGEGYWCSADMDWIIYASHENSITVGGNWLLDKIKTIWPNWEKRKWVVFEYKQ